MSEQKNYSIVLIGIQLSNGCRLLRPAEHVPLSRGLVRRDKNQVLCRNETKHRILPTSWLVTWPPDCG